MEQQTEFCSERDYTVIGNTNTWSSRSVPFYLSFPPGLSLIDPLWKSCKAFEPGVLDPPRTLDKATALVGPGASQTSRAAPGAKPTLSQVLVTPTSTADYDGNNTPGRPTPVGGPQGPDPPIGKPGKDDPPQNPDPPAIPVINSAAASSILQEPPLGGSDPNTPANLDNAHLPGGNGGADPNPGPVNNQAPGPANSPANSDPTLPSIGSLQVHKAEDGGIIIGSEKFHTGARTSIDGTPVLVGSDRVIIGDSTVPLAAPTEVVPGSNLIFMAAPDPVLVGWNTVDRLPDGGIVIASSTYSSGTHATISGIDISVAGNGVIVDGATHLLPPQNTLAPVLIGGQTIAKVANGGGVVVGSSTYLPGVQATAFGTAISVGTDNVVVDGSTYNLPTYPTGKPILIDGESITRASDGGVVVGSSTVAPGSQRNISGHTISAGSASVVIDGSTYALPISTGSEQATRKSIMLVKGVTISAGGSAATISGTTYSIPSDNGALIINGNTVTFNNPELRSVFSIAGQTFIANPTAFVVDGHSVFINGPAVTLSGTVISLGPSGLQLGSSTIPLTQAQETARLQSIFTVGGQTFTANPTAFAVDGHSVSINRPAVTLSGTVLSLGSSGLRIGSSTIPLTPAQETADVGLGGIILSGFRGNDLPSDNGSSPPVVAFMGKGPMSLSLRDDGGIWSAILAAFALCVGLVAYAL